MSLSLREPNNGMHLTAGGRPQVMPGVRSPRRRHHFVLAASLAMIAGLGATAVAASRASEVIGRVVDESGKPMQYMTAVVKGTTKGSFSDAKGMFRIPYEPRPGDSLEVNVVGYVQWSQSLDGYEAGDTIRITLRSRWDLHGNEESADSLVKAIRSAGQVEAFRVSGQLVPETANPQFRHYPVVDTLAQPSRAWLDRLCDILREAARDSCGRGPTACIFQPEYAFFGSTTSHVLSSCSFRGTARTWNSVAGRSICRPGREGEQSACRRGCRSLWQLWPAERTVGERTF
jgi:hypothetical protein